MLPPEAPATQRDVAAYLVALDAAHGICRARLAALRTALEAPASGP